MCNQDPLETSKVNALDSKALRGVRPSTRHVSFLGKGWASNDRWEHVRRIKCPGSRARDRQREAPLRSRSIDLLELLPYSTVAISRAPVDL